MLKDASGRLVLDTVCSRTVGGLRWYLQLKAELNKLVLVPSWVELHLEHLGRALEGFLGIPKVD